MSRAKIAGYCQTSLGKANATITVSMESGLFSKKIQVIMDFDCL